MLIQTEADALSDILSWSKSRPVWQRDALRRLFLHGELSEEDLNELTALCKDPAIDHEALASEHVKTQYKGAPTVSLRQISSVQNVNALAENQFLSFIPNGVTIVYGDNGAGKSGYVRILKSACRARTVRGKEDDILRNVYEDQKGPQRAKLKYDAGLQTHDSEWQFGEQSDGLLSQISVFDTRTANVHVEETNELAYTPFPMKLLENLVASCRSIEVNLKREVASLKSRTPFSISQPSCSPDSEVGRFIHALHGGSNVQVLNALASVNKAEAMRRAELSADFSQDPRISIKRLQVQKSRLVKLQSNMKQLETLISQETQEKLTALISNLSTKQEAARLAAESFSKDEPLQGVGSEAWRELWAAARAYSVREAYPHLTFPNVSEEARCVLCQQPLDDSAAARLKRFETFVQDLTQQEEAKAKTVLEQFIALLAGGKVSTSYVLHECAFVSDELGNTELAHAIRDFLLRANWRLRALTRARLSNNGSAPILPSGLLKAAIDAVEVRVLALEADEENEERRQLRAELTELKDREWLSGIKDDVAAEIPRKKTVASLEAALKDTRTNTITSKITALSEALVSEKLRTQFESEIEQLNLEKLAIELKQARSQHGVSRFKITLTQNGSSNAGDILSEGEYRCVALAGFLAELATNSSMSGIIFDDPVSSLDHLHRKAIANRLAAEGLRRQVIVFTHDLPFLFLLEDACQFGNGPQDKTAVALRHIQKKNGVPGHSKNEVPEKAKNAISRLESMRKHLDNTRKQFEDDPDGLAWLTTASGFFVNLRQAWESGVEDIISPVLRTFSDRVDTTGFVKLSAITQEDAEIMRTCYRRCSKILHAMSRDANPQIPSPDEITIEIDTLSEWLASVIARQDEIDHV